MARLHRCTLGVGATMFLCAALAECTAFDGLSPAGDPDAAAVYGESDEAAADADALAQDANTSILDAQYLSEFIGN